MKPLFPLLSIAITLACCIPASGAEDGTRTYQVRGIVKKLKPEIRTAVIDHETIPGYMDAMTMSLEVRDISEFSGIKAGDTITFRMNVTADDGWIDKLELDQPAATATTTAEADEPAPLEVIRPGDPLPEADLVDDAGNPLKLSAYRGQALAITFIYTRCPFPTFCPRVNNHFRETQKLLQEDAAGPKNWQLLSVTIDPEKDTPEVLGAFAKTQNADAARWKFATGSLREITRLTIQSGLDFWDDRGLIQHNLRTIVVDPSGKVHKVFGEAELNSTALAGALRSAAAAKPCACADP